VKISQLNSDTRNSSEKELSSPDRQEAVLRMLREQTSASMAEFAARFGVSEMTIRRDLRKLSEGGHVILVPGGARLARGISFERSFEERLQKMSEAKDRIGRVAAGMVREGDAIVLDSGTTTLYIARHLRHHKNIVVVTFSLAVMEELRGCESIRVELTGGTYRGSSHDLIGHAVTASLSEVYAQKVFFGSAAVSVERGAMVFDPDAQRSIVQSGNERILVADHSKIRGGALYRFTGFENIDLLITDSGISTEDLEHLRRMTKVMVAE
jgi:DeoR/GlpR family transcriptional regulator of sugar metabolism